MLEGRLTQDKALEKIGKIRSEIENAFAKGSIDFDMIESELKSLAVEIGSILKRAKSYQPDDFAPHAFLRPGDYR
jgi:hypothetical protein